MLSYGVRIIFRQMCLVVLWMYSVQVLMLAVLLNLIMRCHR